MTISISEIIEQKLLSEDLELPVYNPVASRVQTMLADENFDMGKIERLILQDQALTSQVLKVANSAFFAGLGTVNTVREALLRLGARQVSNLVTMITAKGHFKVNNPPIDTYLKKLWDHSVATAVGSSWLASRLGYRAKAGEAFLAGLLHDFGMLFLLRVLADVKKENKEIDLTPQVIEEILNKMHCEQGARLMEKWNLPEIYRDAARFHHSDPGATIPTMVNIVRLADIVSVRLGVGFEPAPDVVPASTAQAVTLGAGEVMLAEMEISIEDAVGLAASI